MRRTLVTTAAVFGSLLMLQAWTSDAQAEDTPDDFVMLAVYNGPENERTKPVDMVKILRNTIRSSVQTSLNASQSKMDMATRQRGGQSSLHASNSIVSQNTNMMASIDATTDGNRSSISMKASNSVASTKTDGSMEFANNVGDVELETTRGTFTADDTTNFNLLQAVSNNNSTSGSTMTGVNLVSPDAFSNAQGVVSLIQNSGNNVIIQSATIVNLTMQP